MTHLRTFPSETSPYWLESTFEIRQVLKTFAKRSEKISVLFSNGSSFVTVVLDVSERGDLVLDASGDPRINALVTGQDDSSIHGVLDRVDIDFKVSRGKLIDYDGAPAIQFSSPSRLHKLQRREFFRIPTPMVKPLMCTIYIEVNDGTGPKSKEFQAQVLDISIGGICLQEPRGLVLVPGSTHKACSMLIPEFGVLRFDLVIRHAFEVENRLGRASRRAGCEFLNLPSAGQQAVQKFMTKLERDRRSVLT